jgi:hypothetical protein
VQPARDPGAGLIKVRHRRLRQLLADPLDEPAQPPGGLGRKPRQHPHRAAGTQHIAEHSGGPLHRQVMGHHQVARQPADPRAVARRRADLLRKHPGGHAPAAARSPLHAMIGDPQLDLGQVEDLPGLHSRDRRQRQIPTAALAPLGPMDHNLVRVGHLGQVRARRAGLLARPAALTTPFPPGRGRLAQPVL